MMNIRKADIIWSYLAQFFSIGANLLILPVILGTLSPEEIGFNYVLMSITGFVVLFDFGFAPQIGRNVTYVYGGAQRLQKEGMDLSTDRGSINYKLL